MIVIAAMIGAGGLGDQVLRGIPAERSAWGLSGLAIVILAMYLDRVTHRSQQRQGG